MLKPIVMMGRDHEDDYRGISNGQTGALNRQLEHFRGFRNLTGYVAKSLVDAGGVRPPTTPSTAMSPLWPQQC